MKQNPAKPSPATIARIFKALPVSADGVYLTPGVRVWTIWKIFPPTEWMTRKCNVDAVLANGLILPSDSVGRHPLNTRGIPVFSTRAAALAEVRKRNGGGK